MIAAGWKKPEDWAGFQAAKDREIHGIREQAIGFQQQARSAGHLASQWEEAYKALAAELGDENRYKLARADIYEQSQQVFAEEYQRASVNTEALEGQLRAATNYVKEHAYDSETGQKLFEPNDPEIRAAIGEVMQATRAQLMASSPQEQMQAGQALDTASAKVRALVRQRETRGYRKLYGTQAAEANRQQHQQNGPMVTPQGAAVGGGNLSFKQRRDQIAQANPNWSDEQIFEATMVGDIEASLRQG